jgi:hypothetical protein
MAVAVSANDVGKPVELFAASGILSHWGVAPDGERFLIAVPAAQAAPAPFTVTLNWQAPAGR